MLRFEGESEEDFAGRYHRWSLNRIASAGVPPALRRLTPLADVDEEVATAVGRWVNGQVSGLVLSGPVGVGKTTLAASAFCQRMWIDGGRGSWRSLPTLMAHLNAGFGTAEQEEAIKVIDGRGMLALDDLDKSRPNELAAERVFAAIDNTITNQHPLLVTTNATLPQLAAHWPPEWGKPIVSRLKGYCQVVVLEGRDRRLGGPQTNEGEGS
jgi:DNA replication protein DnaC